jgi:branched-subunit amino acid aminotransferase/4-amino-4-deoxychorismate lyase
MTVGAFGTPCDRVFVDSEIVSSAEAMVSVHAHALSYGTGTFEGIRAWWNADRAQLYLLEARAHRCSSSRVKPCRSACTTSTRDCP